MARSTEIAEHIERTQARLEAIVAEHASAFGKIFIDIATHGIDVDSPYIDDALLESLAREEIALPLRGLSVLEEIPIRERTIEWHNEYMRVTALARVLAYWYSGLGDAVLELGEKYHAKLRDMLMDATVGDLRNVRVSAKRIAEMREKVQ